MKAKRQKSEVTANKPDHTSYLPVLTAVIIFMVTLIVFYPAFDNRFVNWDDQVYVEENTLVLNKEYSRLCKTPVSLNYHPLTMISLAVQAPGRGKPVVAAPFIKANIWIHIANSLLVFLFVFLISHSKTWVAFFTAAVFAWHPAHVESVVWVSERKDVLYAMFMLLSLLSYLLYLKRQRSGWFVLAFAFFVMSVLSKAMGVVIPLLFVMLDYWHERKWQSAKVWLEKIPLLTVSLFFGLMAVSVQKGGDFGGILTLYGEKVTAVAESHVFTAVQRVQIASYGFTDYIFRFFAPVRLSAYYPYPPGDSLGGPVGIVYPLAFMGIWAAIFYSAKKTRVVMFGMGFYLISIFLVLQILSVGTAITADRYTYVPYIGIAFVLSMWLSSFLSSKGLQIAGISAGAGFLLFLAVMTRSQADVWHDPERLWTQVLQRYPTCDLALANRGNNRGKTGNIKGAMEDFKKAASDGCDRADVYEGLGNCYGTLSSQSPDKKDEYLSRAIEMYRQALKLDPLKGNTYFNLGVAQLATDPSASADAFGEALKVMPYKAADILPVLGLSQINARKYREAAETLTRAVNTGIRTEEVYYNRGLAYLGMGDRGSALADFREVLRLNPSNTDARSKAESLQ